MHHRYLPAFLALPFFFASSFSWAQSPSEKTQDPASSFESSETSFSSNKAIDSFSITLKPQLQSSPLPAWISHPLKFSPESSSLEISLAPLARQTSIDHFALTVLFDDHGDGGPRVEWRKENGEQITLCDGLGMNGPAVGFNARKLLIPYDLAFDGGTLLITHAGRFDQIISAAVQVAHTATVASLTAEYDASLLDEVGNIIPKEIIAGELPSSKEGDVMKGRLMTAELSASTQQQQGDGFDFSYNLEGDLPDSTMLNTEVIGLDLESQIEVRINDTFVGVLNTAPFSLTSTELINTAGWETPEDQTKFRLAGWRKAWLYIPGRVWKQGEENHITLLVPASSSSLVSLRNSSLDLHYSNVDLGHSTTPLAKDLFRY